jgi:hypothetical protein
MGCRRSKSRWSRYSVLGGGRVEVVGLDFAALVVTMISFALLGWDQSSAHFVWRTEMLNQ